MDICIVSAGGFPYVTQSGAAEQTGLQFVLTVLQYKAVLLYFFIRIKEHKIVSFHSDTFYGVIWCHKKCTLNKQTALIMDHTLVQGLL